jgi:hypothetical protein
MPRRRRRRSGLGFPASRPAFPRGGRYAPALRRARPRPPLEALQPGDEYPDATPEGVRSEPGFKRLREALGGGLHGRLDALPESGGDSLAVEYGQGHGT